MLLGGKKTSSERVPVARSAHLSAHVHHARSYNYTIIIYVIYIYIFYIYIYIYSRPEACSSRLELGLGVLL